MWVRAKKIKDEAEHPFTREPVAKEVAELPVVPRDHMCLFLEALKRIKEEKGLLHGSQVSTEGAHSLPMMWPRGSRIRKSRMRLMILLSGPYALPFLRSTNSTMYSRRPGSVMLRFRKRIVLRLMSRRSGPRLQAMWLFRIQVEGKIG
jgi:hypothetical protein